MKFDKSNLLLYAVTDRSWLGSKRLYDQVKEALEGGATCIQLREKKMDKEEIVKEAIELRDLCRQYGVPLIINDYPEVAVIAKADGVHIGQNDEDISIVREQIGDEMILGVSVHSVEEARKAIQSGADYLGVGAAFSTETKNDASQISHQVIKEICEESTVPVVAIGGISRNNILELSGTGLDGVAVVSDIFAARDIKKACQDLHSLSEKMVSERKDQA